MKKTSEFLKNALWLSAAALLLRSVSVGFNAYVAERLGSEGMGLFSLVSGIYLFALTLASAGISLSSTRLVAEELALGKKGGALAALRSVLCYATLSGGGATLFLLSLAGVLGNAVLKDVRTVPSLVILAIGLLPVALSSALGGYFTAVRRVYKNAAVSIFEQSVKMAATVLLLLRLLPYGVGAACAALALGGTVAELLSFLLSFLLYRFDRRRHFRGVSAKATGRFLQTLKIALPIAVSSYARSGLSTVQHLLVPGSLVKSGITRVEALSAIGILHGMVLPVLLFPTAVIGSFAGLLIPEVAEYKARGDLRGAGRCAARALSVALVFSIGTAGLLSLLSGDLCTLLYGSPTAGYYLALLCPVIPVMYLDSIVDAFLKGLGYQVYSMGVNIADAALSILLLLLLLPKYGVLGYIYVIYATEIFNFVLSLFRLLLCLRFDFSIPRTVLFPLLFTVLSYRAARRIFTAEAGLFSLLLKLCFFLSLYLLLAALLGKIAAHRKKGKKSLRATLTEAQN